MSRLIHYIAIPLIAFCDALPSASAATYYDCMKPDGSITYRAEPCFKGEKAARHFPVDLSRFDNSKKESVGTSTASPIDLRPEHNGNYLVPGSINGHAVTFTVDTGASYLSISSGTAAAFGISGCALHGKSATANGMIDVCMTTASSITVGAFHLTDVAISVVPNLVGNPLLGMNVLRNFRIEQENGAMRISRQ